MNIAEIQQALRDEGLDGWLFFDHHRRDPFAYRILQFEPPQTPTRRWYYLIPAKGEPKALVHRIESAMLDALPGEKTAYAGWSQQVQALGFMLRGCSRVAMQYSPECAVPYVAMVDAGTVELIRSFGVEVAGSANLVQFFEARWNAAKLETHMEAGRRVDDVLLRAFEHIRVTLRAGGAINEFQVKEMIRQDFAGKGMVTDHGPIVGVNSNAADPHYEPFEHNARSIGRGDWVLIDLWAKLNCPGSVYYDITWTGHCGETVPEERLKVFHIVREARDRAIAKVADAVSKGHTLHGYEVDDAARTYITEQGYGDYFFHRTGHSIGEEVHGSGANMDNLETHDDRRIIPWTCFSVEPGIYLREFGVRSEVNVFVGPDGAHVTGAIQREPVLLG